MLLERACFLIYTDGASILELYFRASKRTPKKFELSAGRTDRHRCSKTKSRMRTPLMRSMLVTSLQLFVSLSISGLIPFGVFSALSIKSVSASKCARISYVLNEDYQQDLGEHFKYADEGDWDFDILHTSESTCSTHCKDKSAIFSQQNVATCPDDEVNLPANNSFSYIWEEYKKSPDPCHGDDGLCISWLFGQTKQGNCKCSLLLSLMRIHKSGTRNVKGQSPVTCSIEEVEARFQNRFPPEVYGYSYSKYWSQRDVNCEKDAGYGSCHCTEKSDMHCYWDRDPKDGKPYERPMTP